MLRGAAGHGGPAESSDSSSPLPPERGDSGGCPPWMTHPLPLGLTVCCFSMVIFTGGLLAAASVPAEPDDDGTGGGGGRKKPAGHEAGGEAAGGGGGEGGGGGGEGHGLEWVFLAISLGLAAYGMYAALALRRAAAVGPSGAGSGEEGGEDNEEEELGPELPCTTGLSANFAFMSSCLSLNHGCLIACFPLAIPSLGHSLGNVTLVRTKATTAFQSCFHCLSKI
eukprot:SAG22_NODE_1092_length_5588_cov_12.400984_4_plen_224_part_00